MKALSVVELFAGLRPDGSRVVERLQVTEEADGLVLTRSPAFIKGLARGDKISFDAKDNSFALICRSGNLCLRIIGREGLETLTEDLLPAFEKLGGELDLETPRMLVLSVHVSCGFAAIEALLDEHVDEELGQAWFYGNVYDPVDGVTPLNWWQSILQAQ